MELKNKTVTELKQDCKKLKIGGYSKLNKLELVKLIKKNQKGGSLLNNLKDAVDEDTGKKQLKIWNNAGNRQYALRNRITELCHNIVIQKEKNVNKILDKILKINTNNENNNTNLNPFFLNSRIGKNNDNLLTIAVKYNNLPAVKKIIKILKKSTNPFNIDATNSNEESLVPPSLSLLNNSTIRCLFSVSGSDLLTSTFETPMFSAENIFL